MNHCRGVGFDGAKVMSGHISGVAARIRQLHPMAIYVHCFCHRLNLAVAGSCEIRQIQQCLCLIKEVYNFLNCPKKQTELHKSIQKMNISTNKLKLKNTCETRWVERHTAIETFHELLEPTIDVLFVISEWSNNSDSFRAKALVNTITTFEFMISLIVLKHSFSYSIFLSRYLQSPSIDYHEAINSATTLIEKFKNILLNSYEEFNILFKEASILSLQHNITIELPKTRGRPRHDGANQQPEEYYHCHLFQPFLQKFISHLEDNIQHCNVWVFPIDIY